MPFVAYSTTTISSGTALSGEVDLRGMRLVGIIFPSAWTAADVTFQIARQPAADGGSYGNVFNTDDSGTGAELSWDAAASQVTVPDWSGAFIGNAMLKIRSGPSGVPVNQAADRVLTLILHRL